VIFFATLWAVHVTLGQLFNISLVALASAFELVLMSLALADRFNQERKARDLVQSDMAEVLRRSERELEEKVIRRTLELQKEQNRTQELLYNILPVDIAAELSETGSSRPARHDSVTIMFTDLMGFTRSTTDMPADRMVAELNEIFAAFDDIADVCGVEKIKTIGDIYMAAAGLPKPCADHAQRCVYAGLMMMDYVERRNNKSNIKWPLRVGIHSGPVVSGVVGKRKFAFDIWGDTVNVASRIQSAGEEGRVNLSAYTCHLIEKDFECEYRGKLEAKGKGPIDMYFVKEALKS
jgi:class 3 adenylate cyclase